MSSTPIRDGFRATWRALGLVPAEIAWRWTAGGAFLALLILSFVEYANSLKVSNGSWLLWKLGYPPLALQIIGDAIAGSGHKLLAIAAVLVPAMAILWTFAASIGRTATLSAIMPSRPLRFRTVLALNFFRATATLAALIGFAGVFAIAMTIYSDGPGTVPHPDRSTWTLIIGWVLVAYLWSVANWLLSMAPVVAAEENCDALAAIGGALRIFGERTGSFFRVNFVFGLLRVLLFAIFAGLTFFSLVFAAAISGSVVLVVLALVLLAYFAVSDFLYIARLGAYATLVSAQ